MGVGLVVSPGPPGSGEKRRSSCTLAFPQVFGISFSDMSSIRLNSKGECVMRKLRFAFNILAIAVFSIAISSVAQAQATRTWVSGVGDDVNPCSRTAPCKTFAGAISKTFINGEIDALDPGGFGTISILKSITIDGGQGSGFASILASGAAAGVTINLTDNSGNDPLKTVRLRNLSINGAGASGSNGTRTGINGIRIILATGTVFVENVVVSDFSNRGLTDERTTGGKLHIVDSIFRNNGASGVVVLPSSGSTTIHASLDNVRLEGNVLAGISASNGSRVSMRNCVASGNALAGYFSEGPSAASELNLESCLASNNGTGLSVNAGSTMRLSNVHVSDNTTGVANAGTIGTYNNNRIAGNAGGNAHPLPGTVVALPVQ